jgi:hypothetical protein
MRKNERRPLWAAAEVPKYRKRGSIGPLTFFFPTSTAASVDIAGLMHRVHQGDAHVVRKQDAKDVSSVLIALSRLWLAAESFAPARTKPR